MPYGSLIHLPLAGDLTVKLLVEGKDRLLRAVMDVACAASAAAKPLVGAWKTFFKKRCRTCATITNLGCLERVPDTTTARMGVPEDGWMRLGDRVSRCHA